MRERERGGSSRRRSGRTHTQAGKRGGKRKKAQKKKSENKNRGGGKKEEVKQVPLCFEDGACPSTLTGTRTAADWRKKGKRTEESRQTSKRAGAIEDGRQSDADTLPKASASTRTHARRD